MHLNNGAFKLSLIAAAIFASNIANSAEQETTKKELKKILRL
ncbi:hypothetical protein [Pseudoalteromonas sp. PA2MD11]|nr:hypothetical protein [Pseudoalteromonas sp. PA2MD11]